eukprot:scaffold18982_cov40-Phaeocystis_antarctica.AAC.1
MISSSALKLAAVHSWSSACFTLGCCISCTRWLTLSVQGKAHTGEWQSYLGSSASLGFELCVAYRVRTLCDVYGSNPMWRIGFEPCVAYPQCRSDSTWAARPPCSAAAAARSA